jgi:hypothetical protein
MFRGILKDFEGNVILCFESKDRRKILEWNESIVTPDLELEILDLKADRSEILEQRKKEYPSLEEVVDAMFDGGLDEIQRKRQIVKDKYPLYNLANKTPDICWKVFLKTRERYLKNTDYTQLADAPLATNDRKLYREYRKYLRDVATYYNDSTILQAKVMTFEEWREWKRV